jgi:hypothetical protein
MTSNTDAINVSAKWRWTVILAGALYGLIGLAFPNPSADARGWRLAAWAVCGVVYISHIAYEMFWAKTSPLRTAVHVAIGVAIGGFVIASGAMVHAARFSSGLPLWRFALALAAFPIITGLPAFVFALFLAFVVSKLFSPVPARFQPTE